MDEPGGKMLDNGADIQTQTTTNNITTITSKTKDGVITDTDETYSNVRKYFPDGRITIRTQTEEILEQKSNSPQEKQPINDTIVISFIQHGIMIDYYPNGSILAQETTSEGQRILTNNIITASSSKSGDIANYYVSENITKCPYEILPYEEALKQHPIQTIDDAAEFFVDSNKSYLELLSKEQLKKESILVFTADYGLYWWDYKGNYDMILAELGWNNTVTQEIALIRGAATLQNKQWGTILTWKYTHSPYLTDGTEMFEQMKMSYQAGANYVIVFNYSEDPANPNPAEPEPKLVF